MTEDLLDEHAEYLTSLGDSFDAGFLSGQLQGWSTRWSLALGSACGSLSTRAIGGTPAQPALDEAQDALAELLHTR